MWIEHLEHLRAAGKDRWRSCCPVHKGSNRTALSIKRCDDDSYIVHCFVCGANGIEVFNELNLDIAELMGEKESNRKSKTTIYESAYVAIAEAAKDRGEKLLLSEKRKAKVFKAKLKSEN